MSIPEMRKAKKLLEQVILDFIRDFETVTEVTVVGVELQTRTVIGIVPTTSSVRVNVDLLS